MTHPPPRSTLFPYTTLFRSRDLSSLARRRASNRGRLGVRRHDGSTNAASGKRLCGARQVSADRKSTRLNSSHVKISYAVFCLKKKKKNHPQAVEEVPKYQLL